jgi:hypothetical protein
MAGALGILLFLCYVGIIVFIIAGMWTTFTKARQPGWACIIPIYNIYVMTQVAGKPGWFLLLYLIPLVNIYAAIVVAHGVSTNFGHGAGFTIGLIFLPFIFYPILGFGSAQYQA